VQLDAAPVGLGIALFPTFVTAKYLRSAQSTDVLVSDRSTESAGIDVARPSGRQSAPTPAIIDFTARKVPGSVACWCRTAVERATG